MPSALRSVRIIGQCAVLALLIGHGRLYAVEPDNRPVPPSASELDGAANLVQEAFAADFTAAKTPVTKLTLAAKLFEQAQMTQNDPAGQYMLLKKSSELAAAAGAPKAAMKAVNQLGRLYKVDILALKFATLKYSETWAQGDEQNNEVAQVAIALTATAAKMDRFVLAQELTGLAERCARSSKNTELLKECAARVLELSNLSEAFKKVEQARKVLGTSPNDLEANLAVGQFECFQKGDWEKGLPLLALGSDVSLATLAKLELTEVVAVEAQRDLANKWWDAAATAKEQLRPGYRSRAGYWYQKAMPGLSGLAKATAESRLAVIGVSSPAGQNVSRAAGPRLPPNLDEEIRLGLAWLARQQAPDGSWTFGKGSNPGELKGTVAATSLALISFLNDGEIANTGEQRKVVSAGLRYLTKFAKLSPEGVDFRDGSANMYGHGLATIALCRAAKASKDSQLRRVAQLAVNFTVNAQDPKGGGWRYSPHQPGDTSVLGWQITGLMLAKEAKLRVPQSSLDLAAKFLDSAQTKGGYSYMPGGNGAPPTMTAIGLLCRIRLRPDDRPSLQPMIDESLKRIPKPNNMYYHYYVTSLAHEVGGNASEPWIAEMLNLLKQKQERNGPNTGSWPAELDGEGSLAKPSGRLGVTAFCLMTLTANRPSSAQPVKD